MSQRFSAALIISLLPSLLWGCGGGGGSSSSSTTSATTTSSTALTITGTAPGTLIEAFCDNGAYYSTTSTDNNTSKHPFSLSVPAKIGCRLVVTTSENSSTEKLSTPIGFNDDSGTLRTRLMLGSSDSADLGHISVPTTRSSGAATDLDNDGVRDSPFVLDDNGGSNPLLSLDADGDGVRDYSDSDHGGYQYSSSVTDPLDADKDGLPNHLDSDYSAASDDSDKDGLPDAIDANSSNVSGENATFIDDLDGDGYHDDDSNKDGFHDDDADRDGYHDDDLDKDGYHDDDTNKDGYHDTDTDKDGYYDDDLDKDGYHD
ncbi:hypothetical protein [Magnetofaba australis]|uniref:Uncharacterized protein n=1 Tax=Magnetofaba australis IT-1 TaxID=1434232 RepID=A0A1Y2JZ00_9PROT|nr:hypothetical protein [Magnetofaba australis]OSM00125.1 hypothetical protein MAIT1_00557 [Magnetofaba australis IT-1]